jgi:hypothetical protein
MMPMWKSTRLLAWPGVLLALCCIAWPAAAAASEAEPETFACVADDTLEKDVAPEAALEGFSCLFKKWEGSETLHFKVAVKNVSAEPQRFKVNIFLDNGKAVGGLIPRKTKDGLVPAGGSASFIYPVKAMNEKPGAVVLKISTLSP